MTWTARQVAAHRADQVAYVVLHPLGAAVLIADAHGWHLVDNDGASLWERTDAIHRVTPSSMVWAPSGDVLFAAAGGRITALRAESGADLALWEGMGAIDDATVLTIDPTGQELAVGGTGGAVHVFHLRSTRSERLTAIDPVAALSWLGINSLLVATGDTMQQWDTERRTIVRTSAIDLAGIAAVTRAPFDGRTALIDQRGVWILGLHGREGDLLAEVPSASTLAFSRDGTQVLVGTPFGVYTLDTDLVQNGVLTGSVLTGGHMSRAECGMLAVRQDEHSVIVYTTTDAVRRLDRDADTFALRQWATAMAASVGRARSVAYDKRPITATAQPVLEAGEGSGSPGFLWTLDGWVGEAPAGRLVRSRTGAEHDWTDYLPAPGLELAADPAVRNVAITLQGRQEVRVHDARTGEERGAFPGGQSAVLAPDDRDLLAVPAPGTNPIAVLVYDLADPTPVAELPVREGIGRIAWSPDGRELAGASDGKVIIWDAVGWTRERIVHMPGPQAVITRVAWSPDGQLLAVQPTAGAGRTQLFLAASAEHYRELGPVGGLDWAPALAWSPDSALIATASGDRIAGEAEIWSVADGRLQCRIPPPSPDSGSVWTIAWSPSGDAIAVSYTSGRVLQYRLSRPSAVPDGLRQPAPLLARLGAHGSPHRGVPLAVLTQLFELLADDTAVPVLDAVADLRGLRALRALQWPPDARIGLVALLAADLPGEPRYRPPMGAAVEDRIRQLLDVLHGSAVEATAAEPPMKDIAKAIGDVDDPTLALLRLLGPRAVADDPSLPVRMRGLRADLAPLASRQLRLLSVRLDVTERGRAEGSGSGEERAGLARHGRFNRLLPTQLALDEDVFAMQYAEGNLLYRTRIGRLPPIPRSAVIVLDDTPAAHGQVGVTLRTCAHLLAGSLIEHRRRCILLPLGSPGEQIALDGPADLLRIWTTRSTRSPRLAEAAHAIGALVPGLTDGLGTAPLVVLLTHPYQDTLRVPELQTIAVAYPTSSARSLARRTDWQLLSARPSAAALHGVLTRVLRAA